MSNDFLGTIENYEDLGNAVVLQAMDDILNLKKHKFFWDHDIEWDIKSYQTIIREGAKAEAFIKSVQFKLFTRLDPKFLLNEVERKFEYFRQECYLI